MKVLVIMLYWYPYEGPLMPIYGTVFRELMRKGAEITIVTSFPHYRKGSPETWHGYPNRLFEVSRWEGAKIIRSYVFAPVFDNEKLALVYRVLNFISFNISSLFVSIFLTGKADLIFAPSSPPLSNGLISYLVSLVKQCPMVYNAQDLYPDIAVETNLIKNSWLIGLLKMIERTVYRVSTRILTISDGMRDLISKKGVPLEKIDVIENFIDPEFITPGSRDNDFSRAYGLTDAFVVMYAGSIGIPHGVEVLVSAAEILRNESGFIFCMVAKGEKKGAVELLAREKGLRNIIFIPPQPEETASLVWASASVGVVTYRKGLAHYSLPSKLLAVMCASRPVIVSVDGDSQTAAMVRDSRCGLCVEPESPEQLAEAIQVLKGDPKRMDLMAKNGREYVLKNLNRDNITERYESFFRSTSNWKCSGVRLKRC